MTDRDGRDPQTTTHHASLVLDERAYFMVFERNTSWRYKLPLDGEIVVGRLEGVELRLRSGSVSRRHARVTVRAGQATIVDLGSHNGVMVNGRPAEAEHLLATRDVVTLGNVTLIFYSRLRAGRKPVVALAKLLERAGELAAARAPFSFVVLGLRGADRAAVEQVLPDGALVAWDGGDHLVALLATSVAGASEMVDRLKEALEEIAPPRIGVATFPRDGATADAVLAAARAAEGAAGGAKKAGGEAVRSIESAAGTILIADPAMVRLYALLERLAASDLPVLIGGETGTGKEMAAQAVHAKSARRDRPFVALNCAALPESLAESELFGFEKGAFSGAQVAKPGLLETARGGTVFLDEIGDLSLPVQAKLLRVLETKRVMRLGEVKEREIDMRIIAATHRDLEAESNAGRFRQDLYFRLSGATVWLPPLRDRPREILMLAGAFLERACERMGRAPLSLAPATVQVLLRYRWPGNIRELKNVMEYVVAASGDDAVVEPVHLPARVYPQPDAVDIVAPPAMPTIDTARSASFRPIDEEVRELEKARMRAALAACGGNQTRAAELLNMPRRTFVTKFKQYGLGKVED